MVFPLFDLLDAAVERVYAAVGARRDKAALRLVSKRSCSLVDEGVTAVSDLTDQAYAEIRGGDEAHEALVLDLSALQALVGAPWNLQSLELRYIQIRAPGAAALATPGLACAP